MEQETFVHVIYKGDVLERIKEIESESIALTITSPPYYNAKEYHLETKNIGNNKTYEDYLNKIQVLLKDIFRVTIPGGIVVWNTSPVIYDGQRFMIPFDTHNLFIKEGFICRDDITWCKPSGAAKLRCGGWCQNKGKPLTWHPNIIDEKIMVYRKPGTRPVGQYSNISAYYNTLPKDLLTNVWYFNPETHTKWHDAPFPVELGKRCILLYSFIGDKILDPFAGSFTIAKCCKNLARNSVSIELSDEYIELAKKKVDTDQQSLFSKHIYKIL